MYPNKKKNSIANIKFLRFSGKRDGKITYSKTAPPQHHFRTRTINNFMKLEFSHKKYWVWSLSWQCLFVFSQ